MSTGSVDLLAHEGDDPDLETDGAAAAIEARSPLQLFWRRLRRDKVAMTALVFIVLLILAAILAPLIVKLVGAPGISTPDRSTFDDFGLPDASKGGGPGSEHLFGVDRIGRDVFSRTLYGARTSLEVAFISTFAAVVVGVTLGMIAGYYRGGTDTVLSRIMDIQLAFPVLLLAIGLGAACSLGDGCFGGLLQPGLPVVIFTIALAQWPYMARIIRGQTLSLREKEYVEAARSIGAPNRRIIFRELLPNLVAPIIVYSTVLIPTNILFEAALSFLGVGVQPPTPSWGEMISDATSIFDIAWWFMFFPGMALLLTVLAFNLIGDGLQDALNPRAKK